jgi:hypothetical protein
MSLRILLLTNKTDETKIYTNRQQYDDSHVI